MILAGGNNPNFNETPTSILEATSVAKIVPTPVPTSTPMKWDFNSYIAIIAFLILVGIGIRTYINKKKTVKK